MPQQVSDWFERWTEPIRLRSRHAAEHFNRNATGWINSTSQLLRGWYSPLSEPVRSKPPLPRGAAPYFVLGVNYVQYRLAITESGDAATLSFQQLSPRRLAEVTINEIETTSLCITTVTEVGPDRA